MVKNRVVQAKNVKSIFSKSSWKQNNWNLSTYQYIHIYINRIDTRAGLLDWIAVCSGITVAGTSKYPKVILT